MTKKSTKPKTYFECAECGKRSPKYLGRCPQCGSFNSFVEVTEQGELAAHANPATAAGMSFGGASTPRRYADIPTEAEPRWRVRNQEFARVLGGGVVPGSLILVGGDPGIGKSTLLLQVADEFAKDVGRVLYVSGEESARQIKMRGDRMGIDADDLFLVTETGMERILQHAEELSPSLIIIDSIQTTYTSGKDATPGSVSQVRECALILQNFAKSTGVSVILIGHVTKEGVIAGPRVLEHVVDTVLYLEGDQFQIYRLLRSVKNRFGATSEVGVFEMQGRGLVEVSNPSEAFLAERVVNASGSAIAVTLEGTRPLLVEVQALTTQTSYSNPRRTANGIDTNRLLLLIAVLTKRMNFRLHEQDVFVNVVGGLTIDEPAADLAIGIALASSILDRPVPADVAIVGEIGLSGELRAVGQLGVRLNEAAKLGFRRVVMPRRIRREEETPSGLEVLRVSSLAQALHVVLPRE
ncbi:MAG: DNA repair protein RadA [Anaerolineae bacterium]|nr:DNA repair protein RadA [Anaerolineae bacterium]